MPGTHPNASGEGVALVHTLYGSPVQGTRGINDSNPDVQPAGLHSTAPYKPPKRREKDNPTKVLCPFDGCKAFPTKKTGYCIGHSRKLGLIEVKPKGAEHDDDR